MKVLITGASGFVGHHLAAYLTSEGGYSLYGTTYGDDPSSTLTQQLSAIYQLDIRDAGAVLEMLREVQPDLIVHLAAQSHVPTAFRNPWGTLDTNIRGTLNILEAMKSLELHDTSMVNVISSAIYGVVQPDDLPINERQPFNPGDPYAVSKITQDSLGIQYANAYNLKVMQARAFNHTGPGQRASFAIPSFAMQIARIEQGLAPPVLKVGNLAPERDYTDVRDMVRAYVMIGLRGKPGEAYNVASGVAKSMATYVDYLLQIATVDIRIEVDEDRLRPIDLPCLSGDSTKLRQHTGWEPQIPIKQTLRDVLERSRQQVSASHQAPID